jgi:hypothetical protein
MAEGSAGKIQDRHQPGPGGGIIKPGRGTMDR